jgi:hypothetical protein
MLLYSRHAYLLRCRGRGPIRSQQSRIAFPQSTGLCFSPGVAAFPRRRPHATTADPYCSHVELLSQDLWRTYFSTTVLRHEHRRRQRARLPHQDLHLVCYYLQGMFCTAAESGVGHIHRLSRHGTESSRVA